MKKTLTLLFFSFLLAGFSQIYAQKITVSGVVTSSEDNEPLIGVNIVVKGTTTGTITDYDGKYTLAVENGSTLVFSYAGFNTQEIPVAGQSEINVVLDYGKQLSEVVVTAMGISRERKALGYAVDGVNAEDIENSGGTDVINALRSHVSGVSFQNSSGAPGAGSSILIRGITSLDPNASNRPLYVIDGVEVSDDVDVGSTLPSGVSYGISTGNSTQASTSNRIMDINMDDVESINVLKGAAATALYGVRAANGAVIITTKKGKAGKPTINAYYGTSWSKINRTPDIQTEFIDGHRYTSKRRWKVKDGVTYHRFWDSWGPKYREGMDVVPHNTFDEFFRTGRGNNFGASVTAGNDIFNYRIAGGRNYTEGIVPNSYYGNTSFSLNAKYNVSDKFSVEGSIRYSNSGGNKPSEGRKSVVNTLNYMSTSARADEYKKPYKYSTNYTVGIADHPLFLAEHISYVDDVDRYISNLTFKYALTPSIDLNYVVGLDNYGDNRTRKVHPDTDEGQSAVTSKPYGFVIENAISKTALTSNLFALWKKNITDDISLSATLGHYIFTSDKKYLTSIGSRLAVPELYNLSSAIDVTSRSNIYRYRNMAVYGEMTFGYKNFLYLSLTGRNDFTSTLPKEYRSYFFPSASLSIVVSDMVDLPELITFAKLRGSYAVVGKDAGLYRLGRYYYSYSGIPSDDVVGYTQGSRIGDVGLKPEFTKSKEFGVEMRFFKNRFGFDFAYYTNTLEDMILNVPIANSTGASKYYTNAGTLENVGMEFTVFADIVKKKNFSWNTSVNWSKNEGTVKEIKGSIEEIVLANVRNVTNKYVRGGKVGDLYGLPFNRTEDGQLIISSDGYPHLNKDTSVLMGNAMPDFIANWNNDFNFKGFGLSFLWEWKKGGKVIDVGRPYMIDNGNVQETNNRWEKAVFKGVVKEGDGYVPNEKEVEINARYWYRNGGTARYAPEVLLHDASWLRLRNVSLSYTLSKEQIGLPFFQKVKISLNANNVYLNTPYRGLDPEPNFFGSGSNIYGYTGLRIPPTKTYSLKFNFTF